MGMGGAFSPAPGAVLFAITGGDFCPVRRAGTLWGVTSVILLPLRAAESGEGLRGRNEYSRYFVRHEGAGLEKSGLVLLWRPARCRERSGSGIAAGSDIAGHQPFAGAVEAQIGQRAIA